MNKSLFWYLFTPVISIFIIGMFLIAWYIPVVVHDNAEQEAITAAKKTVSQFKLLRSYYTKNVIAKIIANGPIKPSIHHKSEANSIPLPATMIHDLSQLLQEKGTSLNLYSAFPFPNRSSRTLDNFENKAWQALNKAPDTAVIHTQVKDGNTIVRVALADRMVAQVCVNCHNTRADTPKNDWKLGDVRGVLEVKVNIDEQLANGQQISYYVVGLLFILLLVILLFAMQRITKTIDSVTRVAAAVSKGDLNQKITSRGKNDLLASSMNSMISSLSEIVRQVDLISLGDYLNDVVPRSNADTLGVAMQRMIITLRSLSKTAETIAGGDLNVQIESKGENDALGIAMQKMATNLRLTADENYRTNWLQKGQVSVAESLREDNDIHILGASLLKTLSTYVNAQLGTVYRWVKEIDSNQKETGHLELTATYAYTRRKHISSQFQLGEGLIGQAAIENQIIILEQVPDDYIQIRSSLGETTPQNLVLLPFSFHGQLCGVLELAFVQEIDEQTITLLTSVGDIIAAAFENISSKMRLQLLLDESLTLENKIRSSEQRTNTILETSPVSIITLSTESIIESCNATTEKMFSYSKDEILGQHINLVIPEFVVIEADSPLQNNQSSQMTNMVSSNNEMIAKRKDGSDITVSLSISEMKIDDTLNYLATLSNISEQVEQRDKVNQANMKLQANSEELTLQQEKLRQTNESLNTKTQELEQQKKDLENSQQALEQKAEQLTESSRYKSEFLANMSHELRTPLNSLLILSKFLADNEDGNLSEDEIESATVIHESGTNLLQLINDILDLSKVEAGHMSVHSDVIVLSDLLMFMDNRFKHMAKDKGIIFKTELTANTPKNFICDYTKLSQILTNLISNALKFTEKGSVTLSLFLLKDDSDSKPMLSFIVHDTGIGIPKDKQQAIFEAFQQADGSTNRQYGGTGLGLSIALNFAKLLGGHIKVKSEAGSGSQFTLFIPFLAPTEAQKVDPELKKIVAQRLEPLRVDFKNTPPPCEDDRDQIKPEKPLFLLIEDDAEFAKSLIQICHQQEVQILLAPDGETGINLAKQYKLTGIILDYMLPGMDGSDVLAVLQSDIATRYIPVHVISAVDDLIDMHQLGAIGQLTKPVSKNQIMSVLDQLKKAHQLKEVSLLIVEDELNSITALQKLLSKEPVNVSCASTGTEAIKVIKEESFSCIILDLGLPDMTGFELLQTLSEDKHTNLPAVIVYSGQDLTKEEHKQLQKYTSSVILKSIKSSDRLLDEIHLFLDHVNSAKAEKHSTIPEPIDLKKLQGKHVLLVDDDMRNSFSLSKVLKSKGLEIRIAPSGLDGLKALDSQTNFDLVLMDIMMPEMDGYETMQRIRAQEQFKELPIIALTANAMRGDRDKCISAGANDYLTKPVDVEKLLIQIQLWL